MAKRYLFFDIESQNAGRQYEMPPREFVRTFQYAWNDGPVEIVSGYDESLALLREADYVVGHNITSFDLPAMFGPASLEPLRMAMDNKVLDTFVLASLLTPAPYSYTDRSGHTYYDAAKPERAMRYLSLDNLAYQFDLPGKIGSLDDLAKKYNPPKTLKKNLDYGLIPVDDPEFREYAEGDVVAVRALWKYLLDQIHSQGYNRDYLWRELKVAAIMAKMSDNGVLVDTDLAQSRVDSLAGEKDELLSYLVAEYGFPTEGKAPWATTEGKAAIFRALADQGITPESRPDWTKTATGNLSLGGEVLIGLTEGTSAEKFGRALATLKGQRSLAQLALDSTYPDGRVHPSITALQRSGRWSITKPGMTVIGAHDDEDSGNLRTADKEYYVAEPGRVLAELDFSAADARAMAALSGDPEFRRRFTEEGVDAHNLSGEAIFGKDAYWEQVGTDGKPTLRPVAKICLAEGSLVDTDRGPVPIENVTTDMLVWDGESFVTHGGIVYNGVREVIPYDGVEATYDHEVFVRTGSGRLVEVPLWIASSAHLPIATSRPGGSDLRNRDRNESVQPVYGRGKERIRRGFLQLLRGERVGDVGQPTERSDPRMSEVQPRCDVPVPSMVGAENGGHRTTVQQSEQPGVPLLRWARNLLQFPLGPRSRSMGVGELGSVRARNDTGPNRHERELCSGESPVGGPETPAVEQEDDRSFGVSSGALAVLVQPGFEEAAQGVDSGTDYRGGKGDRENEGVSLPPRSRKTRVYDILDTGPHHRFTVQGRLVHNCSHATNYRVGAFKLSHTLNEASEKMGLGLHFWAYKSPRSRSILPEIERREESILTQELLNAWDEAYPWLARFKEIASDDAERLGYVENTWGRRMPVDRDSSYTQGPALWGQSTTREMMADGLLRYVQRDIQNARNLRLVVHDALVVSLPEDTAERDVVVVKECLEAVFDPGTKMGEPIDFPVGIGPLAKNWKEASHG